MGWMLVVSEDDDFQRRAIARAGHIRCVGATGAGAACGLMGSIDVESVLIDALDDVGRRFLSALRHLPKRSLRGVDVLVVGQDQAVPFEPAPDIDTALERRGRIQIPA